MTDGSPLTGRRRRLRPSAPRPSKTAIPRAASASATFRSPAPPRDTRLGTTKAWARHGIAPAASFAHTTTRRLSVSTASLGLDPGFIPAHKISARVAGSHMSAAATRPGGHIAGRSAAPTSSIEGPGAILREMTIVAAEEHDDAARAVVGHTGSERGRSLGRADLKPRRAGPFPRFTAARRLTHAPIVRRASAKHDHPVPALVPRHHETRSDSRGTGSAQLLPTTTHPPHDDQLGVIRRGADCQQAASIIVREPKAGAQVRFRASQARRRSPRDDILRIGGTRCYRPAIGQQDRRASRQHFADRIRVAAPVPERLRLDRPATAVPADSPDRRIEEAEPWPDPRVARPLRIGDVPGQRPPRRGLLHPEWQPPHRLGIRGPTRNQTTSRRLGTQQNVHQRRDPGLGQVAHCLGTVPGERPARNHHPTGLPVTATQGFDDCGNQRGTVGASRPTPGQVGEPVRVARLVRVVHHQPCEQPHRELQVAGLIAPQQHVGPARPNGFSSANREQSMIELERLFVASTKRQQDRQRRDPRR